MLGAVSPWAIRLKLESIEDSGETAGRMYAISTVGSLLGTFLSALLLIPLAGTQRTFLTFALALAIVAAVGLPRRWWLVPLGIAALFAVPVGTVKAAEDGKVIHETDTTYQYARVIDHPNGDAHARAQRGPGDPLALPPRQRAHRRLLGRLPRHAVRAPAPTRRAGSRSSASPAAPSPAPTRATSRARSSTASRSTASCSTSAAATSASARARSCASTPRTPARSSATPTARYDSIFLDTYRQPYIPFYLSTHEFFELVRDRLAPGGSVIVNLGHPEGHDELEKVITATMGERVRPRRARPDRADQHAADRLADARPRRRTSAPPASREALRPLALASADRLQGPLKGGAVYTDDKAPVEWLIDKSIVEYAAGG